MKNQTTWRLQLTIIFTVMLWASAYVGIRAGLTYYSPGAMSLLRYVIASFCMLILYSRLPNYHRLSLRQAVTIAFLGICGFGIYSIALNYGELTVTAGIASFIISQIPVLTTILAVMFFKERLAIFGWLGIVISIIGVFLIAKAKHAHAELDIGFVYICLSAVVGSIYGVWQKPQLKTLHPVEFIAYAMWAGTAVTLIYLPQLWHELPHAPIQPTLWVVYIGIFPGAVAFLLWGHILKRLPITQAASYLFLTPLFTLILGWIILQEISTPLAMTGGIIALLGAYIVQRNLIKDA